MYGCRDKSFLWLFLVAGFLLFRGNETPGFILLGVATILALRPWAYGGQRALRQVRRDAARHGLRMPRDERLTRDLLVVYGKYRDATTRFPQLAPEYDALIDKLWSCLVADPTWRGWRQTLASVLASWPAPEGESVDESLKAQLERTRAATREWRQAQREVIGPTYTTQRR